MPAERQDSHRGDKTAGISKQSLSNKLDTGKVLGTTSRLARPEIRYKEEQIGGTQQKPQ